MAYKLTFKTNQKRNLKIASDTANIFGTAFSSKVCA